MARPDRTHKKKNQLSAKTGNEDKKVESKKTKTVKQDNVANNTVVFSVDNLTTTTAKKKVVKEQKPSIDIEAIRAELRAELKEELTKEIMFELRRELHIGEAQATVSKTEINLGADSNSKYKFAAGVEGLEVTGNDGPLMMFSRNGALGIGLTAPKSNGKGSVHIRTNYASEASIPSTGDYSTRGFILESDSDDDKTYTHRVLSRMNRQGVNITGTGKLLVGKAVDKSNSKLHVYHHDHESPGMSVFSASRYYQSNMLNLQTTAASSKNYNFIEAANQTLESGSSVTQKMFKVDGDGNTYTDKSFMSNYNGYAEVFEWEDHNHRNEDRTGFTVTLTSKGMLRVADEGDFIVGVVVSNAALVGNAAWNHWSKKYHSDVLKRPRKLKYDVVEWLNFDHTLDSHFNSTLPYDFQVPENATVYETDYNGRDMHVGHQNDDYNNNTEYTPRLDREFTLVALLGQVKMYKGQITNPNWIKLYDDNDEVETWIIK